MNMSIGRRAARVWVALVCFGTIGALPLWSGSAHSQTAAPATTAPAALIPAPPGSAQQDLQQPDHAFDSTTGQNLVWDADRKSWIDTKSGQALGFQGALAKDGTVIPAPAPSVAKSGAKTQAKQDPSDPERAYNAVTGQNLVWVRAQSAWIDTKSQKNVGFQGAFATNGVGAGAPGGTTAPPSSGLSFGFGIGGGAGTNDQNRDRLGAGGRQGQDKVATGIGQDRASNDRGRAGGGTDIPIVPILPLQSGLGPSNAPPPVQPSGGHTVERPPTPPAQTAGTPPTVPPPDQPPQTAVAPPPATPLGAVCGPVVTEKVFATLAKMTRDFNSKPGVKASACHNLYGVTTSESAWDIQGLDPGTSPGASDDPGYRADPDRARRAGPPQAKWNPATGTWVRTADGRPFSPWLTGVSKACAIPRPDDACAATVQFMGTCQHAQVVNYVMWGRVNKLCGYPLSDARLAVSARSIAGDAEMRQRQLDMTNIGYVANSADEVRQGFLTTPSQFQKCELKCPIKLPATPWSYIWEGFNVNN
jgi:hypothetical protein